MPNSVSVDVDIKSVGSMYFIDNSDDSKCDQVPFRVKKKLGFHTEEGKRRKEEVPREELG